MGSESLHWSNTGFSVGVGRRKGDYDLHSLYPNLKFYVVGSKGVLRNRNPLNMKPDDPKWPTNTRAGKENILAEGVYGKGKMNITAPISNQDLIPIKLK